VEKSRGIKVLKKWLGSNFDGAIGSDFAEAVEFHRRVKNTVDRAKTLKNTKWQSPSSIADEKAKLMEQLTELATHNFWTGLCKVSEKVKKNIKPRCSLS
jgi:hypothetical protein